MKKKNTAVFGHKTLVEVGGCVCLEFIFSKGRKKTGADKTDSLHLNYQQYMKYSQTFYGLQTERNSSCYFSDNMQTTPSVNNHIAQGDPDKGVWGKTRSEALLPLQKIFHSSQRTLKTAIAHLFLQQNLEIISSHTHTINTGIPSGLLVLFLKLLCILGIPLGSFCAIGNRRESFTYLIKLAFFHVLWSLWSCSATRVLKKGAQIVQFKSRSDFLQYAKALPSEIQCQEWLRWRWDSKHS